jgi:serine/threonine-protein phosphatase CPPED1
MSMRSLLLLVVAVLAVGGAVAVSANRWTPIGFVFKTEAVNPVSRLDFPDDKTEFSFAVVSDRTGSHRANVFSQAVAKLNLMQPQFVVSVGDLIEGGKKEGPLPDQWKVIQTEVDKLTMPFFYVPGNHDYRPGPKLKEWKARFGRNHYHFVYRDVLFLMACTEDELAFMSPEQIEDAKKILADNADVRWTLVFLHQPLWVTDGGKKNGFAEFEKTLAGRKYTVFCGHQHHYVKYVRQGMNYYQLATTGGGSLMRGVEYGEFDHFAWVTMKPSGPIVGNVLLDGVLTENLAAVKTAEPGFKRPILPTYRVIGKAFCDGAPAAGATLMFEPRNAGAEAQGLVEADGSFRLSSYTPFDGATASEFDVTVRWTDPATGKSLVPDQYKRAGALKATVAADQENRITLEMKR